MSAVTDVIAGQSEKVRVTDATPLRTRIRTRLYRHKLDRDLAFRADPNTDPLRRERARDLVGEKTRGRIAASLERLLAEADSPPGPLSSRVPIARLAIRDSRYDLETIVERLKAPAYISPQGVAMVSLLLGDGSGPLYGSDPAHSQELRSAIAVTIDAIDDGPLLAG
jgi:hypothetical protein